jgi:DNA polymerase III epsilon subunit family exonuclease
MELRIEEIITKLYERFPYTGNLLFIDTETTGLGKQERIIEIGAIATIYDGFNIEYKIFEELINPGFPVSEKITEITHISNDMLRLAKGDEVYSNFYEWVKEVKPTKCVAHNAAFDTRMLNYNLIRVGLPLFLPEFECSMKLSRKNLTNVKGDSLKVLAEHFNFTNSQAHRALSDTEVCLFVYSKILLGEFI